MDLAFWLDSTHLLAQISTAYFPCYFFSSRKKNVKKMIKFLSEPYLPYTNSIITSFGIQMIYIKHLKSVDIT